MIRHLDLFAGIGGFSRAVHWLGGTTVGFVEWDDWNRRVLRKHWPEAHFHGDIKTFTAATLRDWGIRVQGKGQLPDASSVRRERRNGVTEGLKRDGGRASLHVPDAPDREWAGQIDLITGGYPCQPFSLAGKRLGAEDDRHLWPEMRRVIDLTRPRFVLAENVAGHVTMGLDVVLSELEADGYTCGAVVIPAGAVNALHRRDRVWIMAHAEHAERRQGLAAGRGVQRQFGVPAERSEGPGSSASCGGAAPLADATARGLRRGRAPGQAGQLAQCGQDVGDAHKPGLQGRRERVDGAGERAAGPSGGEPLGDTGQTPRPLDARPDGLRPGLVRRPAARSPWDDPDVIRAMWADGSWEIDPPRVVTDEPERRQKLMAAGNAIVPIVAYEILRVMLEGEPT